MTCSPSTVEGMGLPSTVGAGVVKQWNSFPSRCRQLGKEYPLTVNGCCKSRAIGLCSRGQPRSLCHCSDHGVQSEMFSSTASQLIVVHQSRFRCMRPAPAASTMIGSMSMASTDVSCQELVFERRVRQDVLDDGLDGNAREMCADLNFWRRRS